MGGRRTTKEELRQLEAFAKEGLTTGEIAQKLGRSPAAIRNLRYRKRLITRAEHEAKALFHQRDELNNEVKALQGQKTSLISELGSLRSEKVRLGEAIRTGCSLLQEPLI